MNDEFSVKLPGVVSINTDIGNGPADRGHERLKRSLEFALESGVEPGAIYELKAVPDDSGLDFNDLGPAVEWYKGAGEIVRESGLVSVLLTFIAPGKEGVLSPHFASSKDEEHAKGRDYSLKLIELAGAAKAEVVFGPGLVDEHFNPDTDKLYDRWDQTLSGILIPKAKEAGVIYAPESIRDRESGALSDVERYRKYVKEVNSPNFKMHLDTAHLKANYGLNYLNVLEKAIKDDTVAHLHISEWGPWNTADNRGAIHEGTPVGKDMDQLFEMLHRVKYKGTIGIEIPHYLFHGAVGREIKGLNQFIGADPDNVLDKFAQQEQKLSVGYVMGHYNAAKKAAGR